MSPSLRASDCFPSVETQSGAERAVTVAADRQASHCPPGPGRMVTMCHTGVRTQLNQSAINNAANTGTSTRCWPALICSFGARHRDQGEQRGGGSAQAVRHAPTSQGQRENGQRPDTGGQGSQKMGSADTNDNTAQPHPDFRLRASVRPASQVRNK